MPKVPLVFLESLSDWRAPEAYLIASGFANSGEVQTSAPGVHSCCRLSMVSHRIAYGLGVDQALGLSASSCC
jgi:hypothetical protein